MFHETNSREKAEIVFAYLFRLGSKVEQLDFEFQGRIWRNRWRRTSSTIRIFGFGRDHSLFALFHRRKRQVPRLDHLALAKRKLRDQNNLENPIRVQFGSNERLK